MRGTPVARRSGGDPAKRLAAKSPAPYIQSLQRGFRILEVVTRSDKGVAVAEIARETGLHVSTTFHLLRTLVALGYVSQETGSRKYRLGPKVFQLGAAAWSENQHLCMTATSESRSVAASRAIDMNSHSVATLTTLLKALGPATTMPGVSQRAATRTIRQRLDRCLKKHSRSPRTSACASCTSGWSTFVKLCG